MNELATRTGQIDITNNGAITNFFADKAAIERIKALSDADFEKEIASFDNDTQTFFRLAREY